MLLLMVLSSSLTAYSQKMVLTNDGDTAIVYTVSQSRFLLQQYYKEKESKELADLLEQNLAIQDSIVKQQREIIAAKNKYISNLNDISEVKDIELTNLTNNLNKSTRKISVLKRNKWIYLSLGVVGGMVLNHMSWKYYKP
jgi:hypothetical protein